MGNHSKQHPKQNLYVLSSIVNFPGRTMLYTHQIRWQNQLPFSRQPENCQTQKQCSNYIILLFSPTYTTVIQPGETHQTLYYGLSSEIKRLPLELFRTPQKNLQPLISVTQILSFGYPIFTKTPLGFLCSNSKTNFYLIFFEISSHKMTDSMHIQPGMLPN